MAASLGYFYRGVPLAPAAKSSSGNFDHAYRGDLGEPAFTAGSTAISGSLALADVTASATASVAVGATGSLTLDAVGATSVPASSLNGAILALSPVGFWLVDCPDDTTAAHDQGSGAHNGTFSGTHSTAQTTVTGDGATTASFASGSACLDPGSSAPYNPGAGDFSLAYWFASTNSGVSVAVGLNSTTQAYWAGLYNTNVVFSYSNGTTLLSPLTYNDGQPHFVVAVRSGSNHYLYVDGAQVATVSVSPVTYAPTQNFSIGNLGTAGAFPFNGRLSKVAYYDKALTSGNVSTIYAANTAGGSSFAVSPTSIQAGRKSVTFTLTGTGTTWTTGGTTFTVSGGTKISQTVASNTSATIVADVGYSTGTLTLGDGNSSFGVTIGVPYTIVDTTAGGYTARVLVPWNYDSGTATTVVIYHHGAGETSASLTTDSLKQGVVNALSGAGYIVCSSTAAGENWGNQAGINAYSALYTYVAANYNVGRLLHFSQSMGGETGLLTFAGVNNLPRTKGWFGIYPVCNLANLYSLGSFTSAIDAAYSISGDYAAKTAGHDPALLAGSTFRNRMMRFWASYGDTTVPQAQNTDVLRTNIASYAKEYGLVECTGNHGDPSHFQPDDVLSFVGRALATGPALASATVPSAGTTVVIGFAEDVLPSTSVTGFSVTVDGSPATISSTTRTSSSVITLAVSTPITQSQTVVPSYTSGNVTDLGSIPLANVSLTALNASTVPDATATGSLALADVTASGSGSVVVGATGSLVLDAITVGGSSSSQVSATGSLTIDALTMSGFGSTPIDASGSLALDAIVASVSATAAVVATGSLTLDPLTMSGSGISANVATGVLDLGDVTTFGSSFGMIDATGSLALGDVAVVGRSVFYLTSDPFAAYSKPCSSGS